MLIGSSILVLVIVSEGVGAPAADAIAAYATELAKLECCEFIIRSKVYYQGPASATELHVGTEECRVRRDKSRWKVRTDGFGINFHQGKKYDWEQSKEYLLLSEGSIYVQKDGSPPEFSVSANFVAAKATPARLYLGNAASFLGFLPGDGDVRLDDILRRNLKEASTTEVVGGTATVLVEVTTELGTHRAWLGIEAGSFPRRIELRKQATDYCWGQPLSTLPLQPAGGSMPPTPVESYAVLIDNVELESTSQSWQSFVQTVIHTHQGSQAAWRSEYSISDFVIAPTFSKTAFEVEMPVPEGTPVTVDGAHQIEYRWQDGWPRKYIDRGSLHSAQSDEFKTNGAKSQREVYLFMISLGAVALACW